MPAHRHSRSRSETSVSNLNSALRDSSPPESRLRKRCKTSLKVRTQPCQRVWSGARVVRRVRDSIMSLAGSSSSSINSSGDSDGSDPTSASSVVVIDNDIRLQQTAKPHNLAKIKTAQANRTVFLPQPSPPIMPSPTLLQARHYYRHNERWTAVTPDGLGDHDVDDELHRLHHFLPLAPEVAIAFSSNTLSSESSSAQPYSPFALTPPELLLSTEKTWDFTHIVRILYATSAVSSEHDWSRCGMGYDEEMAADKEKAGSAWVTQYQSSGGLHTLQMLTLIVPPDETSTGSPIISGEAQPQTTLNGNQLLLARDFLALALPLREEVRRDPVQLLIVAPLTWAPSQSGVFDGPLAASTSASNAKLSFLGDMSRSEWEMEIMLELEAKAALSHYSHSFSLPPSIRRTPPKRPPRSPLRTHQRRTDPPTHAHVQQQRNVLSIYTTYLAFVGDHSVSGAWGRAMYTLSECRRNALEFKDRVEREGWYDGSGVRYLYSLAGDAEVDRRIEASRAWMTLGAGGQSRGFDEGLGVGWGIMQRIVDYEG